MDGLNTTPDLGSPAMNTLVRNWNDILVAPALIYIGLTGSRSKFLRRAAVVGGLWMLYRNREVYAETLQALLSPAQVLQEGEFVVLEDPAPAAAAKSDSAQEAS